MAGLANSGAASRSLSDVHGSVGTADLSFWRRLFAFAGPAYLVSVGYMDPGNWATDLEGGARFGYRLLWVLVMSNAMAILLQTLSARLGIVSGRDLAQACRETYPRPVNLALWVLVRNRRRRLRPGRSAGRGHRPEPAVSHPTPRGRSADCGRYPAVAMVSELRHPHHGSLRPVADRGDGRLLRHRDFLGQAIGSRNAHRPAAAPRRQQPVHRHRHSGRHRDAPQPVPAFRAGADPPHQPGPSRPCAPPAATTCWIRRWR